MGWSNTVVVATTVIIQGTNDGLFVYNGAPALGNLIASITSTAGTDAFGNNYGGPGLVTYAPGGNFVQITGADITLNEPTTNTTWTLFTQLVSGTPYFKLASAGPTSGVLWFTAGGVLLATEPITFLPETWHDMTPGLLNGWTVTPGQVARYRLMPDGDVWIDADLTAGTIAGGTNVWTTPTGYVPGGSRNVPLTLVASTAAAQPVDRYFTVQAHLQTHNFAVGDSRVIVNARYSLS